MRNKNLILNYVFLSCLIILFLNDHIFKFQYTSWFTGKLSDVVGIILLPMLLTYLFPKLKENSVFEAGLFFAFWKSPFSESFIKIYNVISPISIHRVVDESDLLVLLLLPIPYFLIKNIHVLDQFSLKKINVFAVLLPTVFVLMSTSQANVYSYSSDTGILSFRDARFEIKKTGPNLLKEFEDQNVAWVKDTVYILESMRFQIARMGKIDQKAIKNGGDIFKINNTELKEHIEREIYYSSDYKIKEIKIGDRIIKNLRFSIHPSYMKMSPKKFVQIEVREVQIDKNLDQDKVGDRLRELYQSIIASKFKHF
ncbi:hypothetical protein [Chryseobacterium sp. MMS23-Vi53]|uniref:hypothetical protein n=1 Tax=Chryseobacterium sp. MMS23-Vi53 TaxID=3386644 RepID=UPI0039E8D01C